MYLKKEQSESINEGIITEDAAIDELDVFEENGEVYKWLSLLLVVIWAVTLIFL